MTTLPEQVAAYLDAHPILGVDARALAAALEFASLNTFPDGQVLCSANADAYAMFFLVRGTVRVMGRDRFGQDLELARLDAPAMLGHVALIDRSPRSATCICVGEVQVASLDQVTCDAVLAEATPRGTALRRALCGSLARQLLAANGRILSLAVAGPTRSTPPAAELATVSGALVALGAPGADPPSK